MLDDVTAFVTGASRGIGATIATELVEQGAHVSLAARSDGIYDVADTLDSERARAIETDVTSETSVHDAIVETIDVFGGLDCLVNNAGIPGPFARVDTLDLEDWQHTLDVNLTGMFLTVKHAVSALRESEQASVINIGSMQGKQPAVGTLPYAVAKMGVIGLTRTLAFELGVDDITVNVVCPGATRGDRIERAIRGRAEELGISYEEAEKRYYLEPTALGEFVDPDDIAGMVAYLASDAGRQITAQDVHINSGAVWY